MSIVLNEYEWTENKLRERSLGKKPMETLARVARYYADQQYSKREVRKRLDAFLLQCDPDAPLAKWSNTLDKVTKSANRYKPVKIDGISITESELAVIDEVKSLPAGRALRVSSAKRYIQIPVTATNLVNKLFLVLILAHIYTIG